MSPRPTTSRPQPKSRRSFPAWKKLQVLNYWATPSIPYEWNPDELRCPTIREVSEYFGGIPVGCISVWRRMEEEIVNSAAVDERRDMVPVGRPEVQPEELGFGSRGFAVGNEFPAANHEVLAEFPARNHELPAGNHEVLAEFPARNHELPAGNHEFPAGNHDIAAGSHEVAAGTREEGRGNIFFVRLGGAILQVGRPRRQVTCSRCGQQGHNKNNRRCARWAGNQGFAV
ncbi:hypothetical protein Q9L58_008985 [Maublancomyces gigas]|uniref:Uncharacterized protein n=1 Tax=Discina gigas TaxID=1032678 RepID=A0ABR3G883_9PEZI